MAFFRTPGKHDAQDGARRQRMLASDAPIVAPSSMGAASRDATRAITLPSSRRRRVAALAVVIAVSLVTIFAVLASLQFGALSQIAGFGTRSSASSSASSSSSSGLTPATATPSATSPATRTASPSAGEGAYVAQAPSTVLPLSDLSQDLASYVDQQNGAMGVAVYREKARVPLPSGMGANGPLPLLFREHPRYAWSVRTGDEPVFGGLRPNAPCTTECSRRCREQTVPAVKHSRYYDSPSIWELRSPVVPVDTWQVARLRFAWTGSPRL